MRPLQRARSAPVKPRAVRRRKAAAAAIGQANSHNATRSEVEYRYHSFMEPITAFLAIVDRLLKLLERGEARKIRSFEKLVDPLFRDMEPLANDYVRFFREVAEQLESMKRSEDPERAVREAAVRIRQRRNEFLLARSKVRALVRVGLREIDDVDVRSFLMDVGMFFHGSDTTFGTSLSSRFADIFDLVLRWRLWLLTRFNESLLPEMIRWTRQVEQNLDWCWRRVSEKHAELRVKYLKV